MDIETLMKKEAALADYQGEDRIVSSLELKELLQKEGRERKKFFCGMPSLDKLMGGFRPGDLIVIGGFPGEGKSTLGRTLTRRFIQNGTHCLWFQFEETEEEFIAHFEEFEDTLPEFFIPKSIKEKTIHWITDRLIESKVSKRIPEEKRPKVVFIDNLEAIKNTAVYRGYRGGVAINEASLYGLIVQQIKNLAIDLNLTIFLMSNSNRSEGKGRQVILDDSSYVGSQQIAHVADSCWSIWRRKTKGKGWDEPPQMLEEALINISKNRGVGRKTGFVRLKYSNDNFIELDMTQPESDTTITASNSNE